ncbi:unnamed protein product [Effrenium voratum]|uniref:Uncharacterized protein n=1 Tax=Effrenium voratum TaxID=2562239 RepID=A0AA36N302_9DINO|nr:unnamed protein product [Effrenium voratum]CAJ1390393.1 unnamed protein product [Effrenium voratum]CAJ1438073.1 unnamed protein product [Effrenium voratum]
MSGPLGGHQGYMKTFGPAGRGKKRFVTKGFKLGSYVIIKYKLAPDTFIEYEGKIVDKRVGSEDKESYVELKDCLTLNPEGKIVAIDKLKRLTDSYIEECRFTQKRQTPPEIEVAPPEEKAEEEEEGASPMMPGMMPMMPGMMMPGMMMPGMMMPGMPMLPTMMPAMPMMHMLPAMQAMQAMSMASQGSGETPASGDAQNSARSRSRSRG